MFAKQKIFFFVLVISFFFGLSSIGGVVLGSTQTYVGWWEDDKKHEQRNEASPNGSTDVGKPKDVNKHGQSNNYGTYTDPSNGAIYGGELKNGIPHGQGTYTWTDGTKHVGGFKNNKKHGKGTHVWPNGTKYVGKWKDDKRYGQGTYTDPYSGAIYEGELKNGIPHGQSNNYGTYTDPSNGAKYKGELKNGIPHGQGTYTWSNADGRKYVGGLKNNKKHGHGTYTWSDGSRYVGGFKDGEAHGQGAFTCSDGSKYVGEWKDGDKHGHGTYTCSDGRKYVGEFKNNDYRGEDDAIYKGELKEPEYNPDPYGSGKRVEDTLNTLFGAISTIGKAIDETVPDSWKYPATNSSSSSISGISVQFEGQWFLGYIKSIKVSISGQNSYYSATETSNSDGVYFAGAPHDTYDITINAYEKSGSSGQVHSMKASNVKHNSSTTYVSIGAGGSINVNGL